MLYYYFIILIIILRKRKLIHLLLRIYTLHNAGVDWPQNREGSFDSCVLRNRNCVIYPSRKDRNTSYVLAFNIARHFYALYVVLTVPVREVCFLGSNKGRTNCLGWRFLGSWVW
jgi:hypothetical protein